MSAETQFPRKKGFDILYQYGNEKKYPANSTLGAIGIIRKRLELPEEYEPNVIVRRSLIDLLYVNAEHTERRIFDSLAQRRNGRYIKKVELKKLDKKQKVYTLLGRVKFTLSDGTPVFYDIKRAEIKDQEAKFLRKLGKLDQEIARKIIQGNGSIRIFGVARVDEQALLGKVYRTTMPRGGLPEEIWKEIRQREEKGEI